MSSQSYPNTPVPNWSRTWTRAEAKGTLALLLYSSQQAVEAAQDMANFLDVLPGMNTKGLLAKAFVSFVTTIWDAGILLLEAATEQPNGFFVKDTPAPP